MGAWNMFWNIKPPEFSIKTVKHSSFYLHSIHQKKLGCSAPDRLQQNLMYHGKYMTRPPSFSKSSCRWSKIFVVFNTHSSRHSSLVTFEVIMSTLHTFLLSSVAFHSEITTTFCPSECPAECCCDLGVECWMLFWSRRVECYCDCTTRNFRHTNDDFRARCDWLISATTIAPPWAGLTEN